MPETGLLVEVPAAEPPVASWRGCYDPVTTRGIPAHVTALWPFILRPDHRVPTATVFARASNETRPTPQVELTPPPARTQVAAGCPVATEQHTAPARL